MARPTNVTFDSVAAAADAMIATDLKPTVDAIRAKLGGSDSTIAPLLSVWRQQHTTASLANAATDVTPEVISMIRAWGNGLLVREREVHAVALSAEREERTKAEQIAEQRAADLEIARASALELDRSLRQRADQVIEAQQAANELMIRMAVTEHASAELGRKLEEARRTISAAEQRAALAEQKATMLEQMAPSRANNKARRDGAGTVMPPSA